MVVFSIKEGLYNKKIMDKINYHYNLAQMFRFGSRFLKIGLPFGLIAYNNIKLALTKQHTQSKRQKQPNFFNSTDQFSSDYILKSPQNLINNNSDQKQENIPSVIQNTQTNKNDERHNELPEKNQLQAVLKVKQIMDNNNSEQNNNQAQITSSTPQIVIQYLKMHGMTIKIGQKRNSAFITLKNKIGDTFVIQQQKLFLPNAYSLFQLSNFFNPPSQIRQYESIKPLIKNLANDEFIIATFIPEEQQYIKTKIAKSQYDSFTSMEKLKIKDIQEQFRKNKYESGSCKNQFIIIRDPEVAQQLKMNTNKIGDKYVLYKTNQYSGMQTSTTLQGLKYTIKTIPLNIKADKNLIYKGLYHHLNIININEDARNLIRSIRSKNGPSKILLIYSRQKRNQFVNEVKSIALKVGKIMKQEVVVVLTENQRVLTDYFQVIPDDFVTVRLIDTNKYQTPLFTLAGFNREIKNFYSRKVMSGPFSVQNICHFIKKSNNLQEYYQKKKIHHIPSIVSQNQQIRDNTVVLHWKNGCRGCQITHGYLQQVKRILSNLDQQKRFKYEIVDCQQAKNIEFRRINILNEQNVTNNKDHDSTPKLILHTNGKKKDLEVGKILGKISKINIQNEKEVHEEIVKEIISSIQENLDKKQQI